MEALIKRFKTDLHNCVGLIQEPKKLKESIRNIYEKYVQKADMVSPGSPFCMNSPCYDLVMDSKPLKSKLLSGKQLLPWVVVLSKTKQTMKAPLTHWQAWQGSGMLLHYK